MLLFVSYASQELYMRNKKDDKSDIFGSLFLSSRVLKGSFVSIYLGDTYIYGKFKICVAIPKSRMLPHSLILLSTAAGGL